MKVPVIWETNPELLKMIRDIALSVAVYCTDMIALVEEWKDDD